MIIPNIKQVISTYGLFKARDSSEEIPVQQRRKISTGISKDIPKAKNIENMKSRYLDISVIRTMPSGAEDVKKLKTNGRITK